MLAEFDPIQPHASQVVRGAEIEKHPSVRSLVMREISLVP